MALDRLLQDVRQGLRSWRSQPSLYAIAMVALALGIGANTTIFSVVQTVLLRPLPYRDPGKLVVLYATSPKKGISRYFVSSSDYWDWQDRSRTLEAFAGYWRNEMNVTDFTGDPERVAGVSITSSMLSTLGIQVIAGQAMTDEHARPGVPAVALLTYEYWQRRYAGSPAVIGRAIGINGQATTILGILLAGIHFAGDAQIWNTLQPYRPRPTPRFMETIARLRPGVSIRQAQAEMDTIARSLGAEFPDQNSDWGVGVRAILDDLTAGSRPALVVLLLSVSLLLLIACANVANLVLAHAAARGREVAVRAALGAGVGRLARQFFTESLLLAGAGGGLGLMLAIGGVRAIRAFGPASVPRIQEVTLNLPVLLYTMGISIAAGLLFGMAPVLRMWKPDVMLAMREGGRSASGGTRDRRIRSVLVVAQVVLAVVLVNSAGLLVRSFLRLSEVNPGFRTENVVTASLSLAPSRYPKPSDISNTFDRIIADVAAIPGVRAAGTATSLPLAQDLDYRLPFRFLSQPAPQHLEDQTAWHRMVSPGLFRALGARLTAGRDFTDHDNGDSAPVVIINGALVRQYLPGRNPIGESIRAASGGFGPLGRILVKNPTVVGVVADIQYASLGKKAEPAIYFPSAQAPFYTATLVLRSDDSLPPETLIATVRRKIHDVDPDLPLAHVRTMREQVADAVSQPRLQALLLAAFSALALVLGSAGIYGVLSYSVVSRTREIGIRSALGAKPATIERMILGQGMRLVAAGLAIGVATSLATGRLLETLLFGVRAADFATYATVCTLLAAVGLIAGFVPARAGSRIDPMIAPQIRRTRPEQIGGVMCEYGGTCLTAYAARDSKAVTAIRISTMGCAERPFDESIPLWGISAASVAYFPGKPFLV